MSEILDLDNGKNDLQIEVSKELARQHTPLFVPIIWITIAAVLGVVGSLILLDEPYWRGRLCQFIFAGGMLVASLFGIILAYQQWRYFKATKALEVDTTGNLEAWAKQSSKTWLLWLLVLGTLAIAIGQVLFYETYREYYRKYSYRSDQIKAVNANTMEEATEVEEAIELPAE